MAAMMFKDGTAVFIDRAAQRQYQVHAKRQELVAGQLVTKAPEVIKFQNNVYRSSDRDTVKTMLRMDDNFDREWGFTLDMRCLPKEVRGVWSRMSHRDRVNVCLRLADGSMPTQALKDVDLAELRKKADTRAKEFLCPVTGCGIHAVGKNAAEALEAHVKVAHPEAKLSELIA